MEIMLAHWDGYAQNRNNYRVFHDFDSGRLVFLPHGLDQMFGVVADASGVQHHAPVARVGRQSRFAHTRRTPYPLPAHEPALTNVFQSGGAHQSVQELATLVRPTLPNRSKRSGMTAPCKP